MADCRKCIHKEACAIFADNRNDVILKKAYCRGYKEVAKKPIIRHCKNCEWSKEYFPQTAGCNVYCSVKYKGVQWERITALLCRYYKQEEGADND